MTTLDPPVSPSARRLRPGACGLRRRSMRRRCFSRRCCCSRCSRCSPRWCCRARRRADGVVGRDGVLPGCAARPATPMRISWCAGCRSGLAHSSTSACSRPPRRRCRSGSRRGSARRRRPASRFGSSACWRPRSGCRLPCSRRARRCCRAGSPPRDMAGANPYVLYAASNLGSFAALMAYPFVIEPLLPLGRQAQLWSAGYCRARRADRGCQPLRGAAAECCRPSDGQGRRSTRDRLLWTALSAIPAGLVIAVTSYMSPPTSPPRRSCGCCRLALYLLTFVAVFRDRPWIGHDTVALAVPIVVAPLAIGLLGRDQVFWLAMMSINLVAFVLLALLCHGELYRRRPAPARLTEFYLWVSLGGVLGGIFAALVAPLLFTRIYEYPILIAAALLVLPGVFRAAGATCALRPVRSWRWSRSRFWRR